MRLHPALACALALPWAALAAGAERPPARIDSLAGPVQILHGQQSGSYFGVPVAGAGDVDGDGYDDVIVSAWAWHPAAQSQGRIFVYRGRAGGLDTIPAWTVGSAHPGAQFGFAADGAGDVDRDGYADLIVGAPTDSMVNEGRAFLFRGTPAGLDTVPVWEGRGVQPFALFGWAVAPAGDVNGDGYPDVAVSAGRLWTGAAYTGAVFVYYGTPTGLSAGGTMIPGLMPNEWFGFWIEGAGDVNGDGFDDVIVGAIYTSNPEQEEGRAYLFLGSASGIGTSPAWMVESDDPDAHLGWAVDGVGDLDGDGYDDLIVSAQHGDPFNPGPDYGPGVVFVYHGAPGGPALTPDAVLAGAHSLAHFGQSAAGLGDLDGDGHADFVVGAYNFTAGELVEGRVQIFRGTSAGVDPTAAWTYDGNIAGLGIGASAALAGDINGDGVPDLVVGCGPTESIQDVPGSVYVFLGIPLPVVSAPTAARQARDFLELPAPTPFRNRTTLAFSLAATDRARLSIHDLSGRRVRALLDEPAAAGAGRATWDGRDDRGLPCPAGIYLARLSTQRGNATRRVVYLP